MEFKIPEIKIPAELLLPTVEELEQRTVQDLETKWKPCKRPGKRERNAIKQKNIAKPNALAESIMNLKPPRLTATHNLSNLFAQSDKPRLKATLPTLRVSLGESTLKPASASASATAADTKSTLKRGRPPKLKSI